VAVRTEREAMSSKFLDTMAAARHLGFKTSAGEMLSR
jgi:hypothetical protein